MKRITISEKDSTLVSAANTGNEVVYVPGFAWAGEGNTQTLASKWREPHLCTSISEFENYFGTSAPKFFVAQYYPQYSSTTSGGETTITSGFDEIAIPDVSTTSGGLKQWYMAQDVDPAYTYAKELLSQGLSVVYERLNKVTVWPTVMYETWKGEWVSGTTYSLNDLVSRAGKECYYMAGVNNPTGTPGEAGTTDWTPWRGVLCFDETKTYAVGDVVYSLNARASAPAFDANSFNRCTAATHYVSSFEPAETSYSSSNAYAPGDVLVVSNVAYVCIQADPAGENHPPASSAAYWSSNVIQDEAATWAAGNSYNVNDVVKVTVDETTTYYRCIEAHVSSGSSIDTTKWVKNLGVAVYTNQEVVGYYYVVATEQGETSGYKKLSRVKTTTFEKIINPDYPEMEIYDVTVNQYYSQLISTSATMPLNTVAVYHPTSDDGLANPMNPLVDQSAFNIKYFTTGGWPNFEYIDSSGTLLSQSMAQLASIRGDAVALIDHTDHPSRPLVGENSVYERIGSQRTIVAAYSSFATMMTPWGTYSANAVNSSSSTAKSLLMPASFGYLSAVAYAQKNYNIWLPVAGGVRGVIRNFIAPHINSGILSNTVADNFQVSPSGVGTSINAITYVNPYGYCVWGNRTLLKLITDNNGFASEFLNLRNVLSDIKKASYKAAQKSLFGQNDFVLWTNFRNNVSKTLDSMKTNGIIKAYRFSRLASDDLTKLSVVIKVWPIYAVESVDILVNLTDEAVETTEIS